MIEHYDFGRMTVDGIAYDGDLKIIRGQVFPNWFQEMHHKIQPQDLTDIPEECEFLVIGNGYSGQNTVTTETVQMLEQRGLPYQIAVTGEALKTFNALEKEGKKVMGAFHVTC